jgi:hypothetical protein
MYFPISSAEVSLRSRGGIVRSDGPPVVRVERRIELHSSEFSSMTKTRRTGSCTRIRFSYR